MITHLTPIMYFRGLCNLFESVRSMFPCYDIELRFLQKTFVTTLCYKGTVTSFWWNNFRTRLFSWSWPS